MRARQPGVLLVHGCAMALVDGGTRSSTTGSTPGSVAAAVVTHSRAAPRYEGASRSALRHSDRARKTTRRVACLVLAAVSRERHAAPRREGVCGRANRRSSSGRRATVAVLARCRPRAAAVARDRGAAPWGERVGRCTGSGLDRGGRAAPGGGLALAGLASSATGGRAVSSGATCRVNRTRHEARCVA